MCILRLLFIAAVLVALTSCSSAPTRTQVDPLEIPDTVPSAPVQQAPEHFLNEAQLAYSRSGDLQLRNQWLLKAAQAYLDKGECQQSNKVVYLLKPELSDPAQHAQANLLLAECLLSQPSPDWGALTKLTEKVAEHSDFSAKTQRLTAHLLAHQERWLEAAKAILASDLPEEEASPQAWQYLQQLSHTKLEQVRLAEPNLQAWVQLSLIIRQFALKPGQLAAAISDWRQGFADHPLSQQLPSEVEYALSAAPLPLQKVAILLPLSGRLQSQGTALKEGILAAYFDQQSASMAQQGVEQIRFFDTARYSSEELADILVEFDLVLGPLLKEDIQQTLAQLPANKPMLALNRPEQFAPTSKVEDRYFFALRPEDEAAQLAAKVRSQGALNPVVVSYASGTPKRMADAFFRTWEAQKNLGDNTPRLATFTDNKSMRSAITSVLDVAQSNNRIRQIEYLLSEKLHAVPRNRRDIDAIVIFADPDQTELLNPIIEASLSPFNQKRVSVFASSRSYSLELSNNSLRDLRDLTFSDMPWMLPDHPWDRLATQARQLWPQRSDLLNRLFAMGYDSFSLLPHLRVLRALPQISMPGLTGILSLSPEGEVKRQLAFGQVTNKQVILLALE